MTHIWRGRAKLPNIQPRLFSSASNTIDNPEIEHFQKFASFWWDQFGIPKPLHAMNRMRVPLVRDGLINDGLVAEENVDTSTPLRGLSILDVGCGGGIFAEPLSRLGAKVTGLDANVDLIEVAKSHAKKGNLQIEYLFSSIEDHAKEHSEKYDAVTCSEVIEHVTEKEKFLAACVKCLKPSGAIFLTTMNKTLLADLLGIRFAENVLNLIPKGTHQIDKFIEPHRLQRLLEDCNVRTKLVHGMVYNCITNNWHWCSDTTINYCLHGVKTKENNK